MIELVANENFGASDESGHFWYEFEATVSRNETTFYWPVDLLSMELSIVGFLVCYPSRVFGNFIEAGGESDDLGAVLPLKRWDQSCASSCARNSSSFQGPPSGSVRISRPVSRSDRS